MERYYSDDPEAIFAEARVVSPNRKIISKSFSKSANPGTFDCEICYLTLPKAVSKNIFSHSYLKIGEGLLLNECLLPTKGVQSKLFKTKSYIFFLNSDRYYRMVVDVGANFF